MGIVEQSLLPGSQKIILIFPGEPKAVQSTRFTTTPFTDKNGKKRFSYEDQDVKSWKGAIRWQAVQQLPKPFQPMDGAISLKALFVFTPPKSLSKKQLERIKNGEKLYKTTKPDLTDNLLKGVIDALKSIVFTDDARICRVTESEKIYGLQPFTKLEFIPIV